MVQIKLGDIVLLGTSTDIQFIVVDQNSDGTFEIEAKIDSNQVIRYGHISKEMMRVVNQ